MSHPQMIFSRLISIVYLRDDIIWKQIFKPFYPIDLLAGRCFLTINNSYKTSLVFNVLRCDMICLCSCSFQLTTAQWNTPLAIALLSGLLDNFFIFIVLLDFLVSHFFMITLQGEKQNQYLACINKPLTQIRFEDLWSKVPPKKIQFLSSFCDFISLVYVTNW